MNAANESKNLLGISEDPKRNRYKPYFKAVLLLFILGVVWVMYALFQVTSERSASAGSRADVGIVLGAALWNDQPSPGLLERLEKAAADYEKGRFKYVIVTGGLDAGGATITEAEGMADYLISHGIPESAILLEDRATSTYENLLYSRAIMREQNLETAIIITHDFHGRRALEVARTLDYVWPKLSLIHSTVLNEPYYIGREVLAYTKWKFDQIGILFSGA